MQLAGSEIALRSDAALPAPLLHPPRRDISPYWAYLGALDGLESGRTMRRCLDRIAILFSESLASEDHPGEFVPWEDLRYQHVGTIRSRMLTENDWSPSHVNKHLSALRSVMREAWRLKLMSAEDYQAAREVRNVKAHRELTGRHIPGSEVRALLAGCLSAEGPIGVRDAALAAVLHSTGIRRDEAASALIERYDAAERALKVTGKGNKERTVYIHPATVPYLDRWLVTMGARRGPMFRRIDRWGRISGALTARSIGAIIDKRRRQAGLPPTSTHDFRRTFIGEFIDAGGDLILAQQLAGHASATTTARYDRRPERQKRAAVDDMPSLPSPDELQRGAAP